MKGWLNASWMDLILTWLKFEEKTRASSDVPLS